MLRWLIAILLVANLVALAAIQGLFGPPPAAGAREPWHLTQQVRPQALHTTAVAQAAEQPVVGGPISSPPIESQPLAASSADAASGDGAASAPTPGSAPGSAPAVPAAPSATSAPSASTSPAHLARLEHLAPLAAATLAVAPAALAEGKRRRAAASRPLKPHHKLRA
ncbi:hypothetical protein QHI69_05360 [Burkholderia gladioli pv. gladioli]|uniref:Uncharacterized protein n=1 Tax=Burkholderia gladioli TaxID=28095 RepID=A0AAW3F967_BURGA|nr:hypothetical protein [Burkholderia gladioli]AJX00486.1 hypothetical protein BM43_1110 [Burkholderia gladioli]KGC16836.1 hypothetical protein DM48_4535 [Burkholderia gladioli]MDJ1161331.1 hypothetical protein [Burkholderia gladioli pv. gladioli]SQA88666.1 Uncharacterised protein [Burkholderia gladioli]